MNNSTWVDVVTQVLSKLNDPALIISFIVIILQYVLIFMKEKMNQALKAELSQNSKTLESLTKLIEVLVYGRGGRGSDSN